MRRAAAWRGRCDAEGQVGGDAGQEARQFAVVTAGLVLVGRLAATGVSGRGKPMTLCNGPIQRAT